MLQVRGDSHMKEGKVTVEKSHLGAWTLWEAERHRSEARRL